MKGFSVELCTGAVGQKTRVMMPKKEFDVIFSRVDRMHERDRRTDGQTPGDSRDRAYA